MCEPLRRGDMSDHPVSDTSVAQEKGAQVTRNSASTTNVTGAIEDTEMLDVGTGTASALGITSPVQDQTRNGFTPVSTKSELISNVPFKRALDDSEHGDNNAPKKHSPDTTHGAVKTDQQIPESTMQNPSDEVERFPVTEQLQVSPVHEKEVPSTIPAPATDKAAGTDHEQGQQHSVSVAAPQNFSKPTSESASISRAASATPYTNGEAPTPTTKSTGSAARVYLKEQVNDFLLHGMRWLATSRPENGLLALGQYLQSADRWRKEEVNTKKDYAEFNKYWIQYQTWSDKNEGKSEADYRHTLG